MKLIYSSEADSCDECCADNIPLVEIGIDGQSTRVCRSCLEKAIRLIGTDQDDSGWIENVIYILQSRLSNR